jgi:phenylalanyl-tRNA synthetase beta chain
VKGIVEGLLAALNPELHVDVADGPAGLLDAQCCSQLVLDGQTLGYLGELGPEGLKQFQLRSRTTIAELDFTRLVQLACLVPHYRPQSPFPAICQDVNLIVEEKVRWADLNSTINRTAGESLEEVVYRETYRDPDRDGPGKKRLLFSITLRAPDRTLTSEEAEAIRQRLVDACRQQHQAVLLG